MRERLIAALVGLTVLVVALYGIPRAYFLADLVRTQEHDRVERTAGLLATMADKDARFKITAAALNTWTASDERITVRTAAGKVVASTDGPVAADGDVSASKTLARGGTITVSRGAAAVSDEVSQALLPLLLTGLGLIVAAAVSGFLIARRLARPFQELAEAARGLGTGQLHPELPPYQVPEAKAIAEALRTSGERIDVLLSHERDLAVHASHELRTPVTALRLDLEDLALWPETPPAVATHLRGTIAELDRLSAAIADLLAHTRDQAAGSELDLDLDALLADVVTRLTERGLPASHQSAQLMPARLDPQVVEKVLELLVEEAEAQGAQRVLLSARDLGSHHEVRLVPSPPGLAAKRGSGWAIAAELMTARGGQLVSEPGGDQVLLLPKHTLAGDEA